MRVIISARKGHSSPDKFTHYMAVSDQDGRRGIPRRTSSPITWRSQTRTAATNPAAPQG